jgi:hypothetical protein
MHAFQQDLSRGRRRQGWSLWIIISLLALSAVASSTSATLEVRVTPSRGDPAPALLTARFPGEALLRGTWIAYRPWDLGFGTGIPRVAGILVPRPSRGWCTRTVSQGATPWGTWDATLTTCLHGPGLSTASAEERGAGDFDEKERSP